MRMCCAYYWFSLCLLCIIIFSRREGRSDHALLVQLYRENSISLYLFRSQVSKNVPVLVLRACGLIPVQDCRNVVSF